MQFTIIDLLSYFQYNYFILGGLLWPSYVHKEDKNPAVFCGDFYLQSI